MKKVETLIIGAGVSGLTYGSRCEGSYLIVEKEDTPGGLCRTFYQDSYIWDYAGHFFHFATEEIKKYFESRIPKSQIVRRKKNTKIYYKQTYIDYPFQMNIHQLPKEEFIDCLYDLHFRNQQEECHGFEGMLYNKFGKSITEKFLKPYNEKLYACDLNTLDTDAMGRFFPYASETDIIANMRQNGSRSYNDYFEYPKKGAQQFIDVLLEDNNKDNILLGVSVKKTDLENHIVHLSNGDQVEYGKLVNTIPLNDFIALTSLENNVESQQTLSGNKVVVFNLGFDKDSDIKDMHWIYYPEKEYKFYRVGFYNNILGTDKMSLYVEIGCNSAESVDEKIILEQVLRDLKKCGIISNQELSAYNCLEMKPAYVHITEKSNEYVKKLFEQLETYGVFSIGRYGGWRYCSIEDCMIEAIELSRRI